MKRIWLSVIGIVLAVSPQNVFGQPVVAVVNVPAVSERYKKTADLEAHFDAIRRNLNEQRNALREKIERTARSLEEELKPGTEDFRARRKELALLEWEHQYFVESEGQGIERGLAVSLRAIFDDIHATVKIVAEEKGIDIVLAGDRMPQETVDSGPQVRQHILLQKVLYWSPKVDLTDAVVERLNARYEAQGGKASIGSALETVSADAYADRGDRSRPRG